MITVLIYMALAVLTVFLAITVYNFITAPMLRDVPPPANEQQYASNPFVSVLVPARNEAANIGNCLAGLLAQSYKSMVNIVLDGRSEDMTTVIVQEFAKH